MDSSEVRVYSLIISCIHYPTDGLADLRLCSNVLNLSSCVQLYLFLFIGKSQTNGRTDERTHGRTTESTDEWTHGRTDKY